MAEGTIEQLLKQLESGEPEAAWSRFLEDYAALIYGVARHFEPDDDRAADCFQFVCEQLVRDRFRRLRRFDPRGPASFPTWLRAVVRNLCLDRRRQEFGRLRIFRSISRLSALDQEVFRCFYERGHTTAEAALFLTSRFPAVTPALVRESLGRIEEELTASQRWRLGARALLSLGRSRAAGAEVKSPEPADPAPDPEDRAARREALRALARAFEDLTPRERLLVRLRLSHARSASGPTSSRRSTTWATPTRAWVSMKRRRRPSAARSGSSRRWRLPTVTWGMSICTWGIKRRRSGPSKRPSVSTRTTR